MNISDRLLNITFKFSKVVSVFIALLLVLAFIGSLAYALFQWKNEESGELPDFDKAYNERVEGNRASTESNDGNSTAAANELRIDITNKYGSDLNPVMTSAGCTTDDFDTAIRTLVFIAENESTNKYVDDVADGAIVWFEKAAAMRKDAGTDLPGWVCSEYGYWSPAMRSLDDRQDAEAAATENLIKGLGMALMTLIAAFLLMVIPAIYRIEESVRRNP